VLGAAGQAEAEGQVRGAGGGAQQRLDREAERRELEHGVRVGQRVGHEHARTLDRTFRAAQRRPVGVQCLRDPSMAIGALETANARCLLALPRSTWAV
jgi:hypothetical protein